MAARGIWGVNTMARPRLGVGFEGLYLARLAPGQMPDLARAAEPASLHGIVIAANRCELVVYPLHPAPGLACAIRAWLLCQLERHFADLGYRRPEKTALYLVDRIEFAADRSAIAVDLALETGLKPLELGEQLDMIETMPGGAPTEPAA